MQVNCVRTGYKLVTAAHFPGTRFAAIHPIFSIPLEQLLVSSNIVSWHNGKFGREEKVLLLLAVASQLDLLVWPKQDQVPANPSNFTLENSWHSLLSVASWLPRMQAGGREYPRYVISPDTASMENFPAFLRELGDSRNTANVEDTFNEKAKKFLNQINAGNRGAQLQLHRLAANWVVNILEVDEDKRALWVRVLTASDERIREIPLSVLKSIEARMELELPGENFASVAALRRIRYMMGVAENKLASLALLPESFGVVAKPSFTIVGKTATQTTQVGGNTNAEPKREDFPDKVAFLLAKARWAKEQAIALFTPEVETTPASSEEN